MARELRRFEEGRHYELTDRVVGSRFRLLPSVALNAIILAALHAALAIAPDVGLLGITVMGNHWHLLVRAGADPAGVSRFMQAFKSIVARDVNQMLGEEGAFWKGRFRAIPVLDHATVLARLVYFALNPVAAKLCARFEEWTGVSSAAQLLGVSSHFELPLELPPRWQDLDDAELTAERAKLLGVVRERESELADERRRLGLPRPHVKAILAKLHHDDRPAASKRGPCPLCFASSAHAAATFRAERRAFRHAFTVASARFRNGELDIEFPARAQLPRLVRGTLQRAA